MIFQLDLIILVAVSPGPSAKNSHALDAKLDHMEKEVIKGCFGPRVRLPNLGS